MKYIISFLAFVFAITSCELPSRNETASKEKNNIEMQDQKIENEEYVMVTTAVTMPMYVNHDQAAFKRWGEKMGVKVSILGPAEWDVPAQIKGEQLRLSYTALRWTAF